jgi:hypothetical protein
MINGNTFWRGDWGYAQKLAQALFDRIYKDKPKEYCCTCEPHFESRGTALCSICHKPYTKPIKTEKIEPLVHETRWDMDKQIVKKINEVIDHINKKGV